MSIFKYLSYQFTKQFNKQHWHIISFLDLIKSELYLWDFLIKRIKLCCLLSQFSSLSIEDQEDTQFPFAMRDLPPVSQPGDQHQTPGHQASVTRDAGGTAPNGRLPSLPGTPTLPRPVPCHPADSPPVPPRAHRVRPDAEFSPIPLRRQLVSQVSLDCPPSPSSRPHSPWGRSDPYDSPEVCFCVLLFFCDEVLWWMEQWCIYCDICAYCLQDQDKEYVGFATLPNQVHRKTVKKGFTFTLMVAGELSCMSACW